MGIKLEVEVHELDFILQRLVAGQMDFQTAMNANTMVQKLVKQANDPAVNAPLVNGNVKEKE